MNIKFNFADADNSQVPVPVFEQIFAEVSGGAMVSGQAFDVLESTAVGYDTENKLQPIKAYKVVNAVESADTTIKIKKGSGVSIGDVITYGKKGVSCTDVDTTNADYDVVTVTMGVAIAEGTVLYQGKTASTDATEPIYTPIYLLGDRIYANEGDAMCRLINGANIRRESCNVADEVVALMKGIHKI